MQNSNPGGSPVVAPEVPSPQRTASGADLLRRLDYSVLQQCIHCGLCLPSCPTYAETQRERNSPRGRIALMRSIADGEVPLSDSFADEMSYCLGCLACTSACPAGVDYASLVEVARAASETIPSRRHPVRRMIRWALMRQVFVRPWLLRALGHLLGVYQRSGLSSVVQGRLGHALLPARVRQLEGASPRIQKRFSDSEIALNEWPRKRRHRVAVLTGCVQDIAFSDVNRATVDVLLENGCEVWTPRAQGCCGSLHAHNGDLETARFLAKRLIDQIDAARVDAIISNAGGCGSHLKRFDHLLADDPNYAARAEVWSAKVRDVSEWLVEIGFRPPRAAPFSDQEAVAITYHEACHLCHGQGISRQPREILRSLPGIELRETAEATWCCGSAGIYSLTQPETASALRERKWQNLSETGANLVAMGNPGCAVHLQRRPGETERAEIVHPVVLLARAYANEQHAVPI